MINHMSVKEVMERKEISETNQMFSPSRNKVQSTTGNVMKTPKRVRIGIVKDVFEENTINTLIELDKQIDKAAAEVSLENLNKEHEHLSPEPEIRRRKKRSALEDKTDVPVKRRSSSRSTKGKHSKQSHDVLPATAQPSLVTVTQRKPTVAGVNTESSSSLVSSAPKLQFNVVKVVKINEVPAENSMPTELPLQKPLVGTPGTARKRVCGEGRTASLQKIMLELPNLCDPNVFSDILMKAYGSRLEASKVFECLTTNDLKDAIIKRFTPSELMAILQKSGKATGKLLTMASTEAILHEVQSREELKSSEKLLDILLQNLSKTDNANVGAILDVASVDAIVKAVNSRSDLKSSEKLFSVLLQNLPEKMSEETKKSVIKVLIEKFNTSELVDISHEAIKMSVNKIQRK